jgi:beta-1,4-mannosyl-glycoprotein beta-1,4-N-acetylglucosaminyltransferase
MIYDCFTFFNELDILEIRLNILYEHVDKFIISESTKTHSNLDKELIFLKHKDRFSRFMDKIDYFVVDQFPIFNNAWDFEVHQRNEIKKRLADCNDSDLIMISDVDEIPNPIKIYPPRKKDGVVCLLQDLSYYYLNCVNINYMIWPLGTKIVRYQTIKNDLLKDSEVTFSDDFKKETNKDSSMTKLRLYRDCEFRENGGWHFSYMGGSEMIKIKLKSFAHQEFSDQINNSVDNIAKIVSEGKDVLGRKAKFVIIDNINSLPLYIQKNKSQYIHLFDINSNTQKFYLKKLKQLYFDFHFTRFKNYLRRLLKK